MQKSNYNKTLKNYARSLRNNSTLGEIILWQKALSKRKMYGLQFNRQFPIGRYIADFICRKINLVIEIDGYSHNFKHKKDIERDKFLNGLGFAVLRFSEKQVRYDLNNVVRAIENYVCSYNEANPPNPHSRQFKTLVININYLKNS